MDLFPLIIGTTVSMAFIAIFGICELCKKIDDENKRGE